MESCSSIVFETPPVGYNGSLFPSISFVRRCYTLLTHGSWYRLLHLRQHHHLPFGPPLIGDASWRLFWTAKMSPFARRTWYRLIHRTWPSRAKMLSRTASPDSTAACPLCTSPTENTVHMAISCPYKLSVWSRVWALYFPTTTFDPDVLWQFLTTLRPVHPLPRHQLLLLFQVTGSALQAIWRGHWALHFRNVPFVGSIIFGHTVEELSRIRLRCAAAPKVG